MRRGGPRWCHTPRSARHAGRHRCHQSPRYLAQLLGAEAQHVSRVVYFSSAQVFGFTEGEGVPAYRPVDDRHPLRAVRPYGMSKRLAEEMCEAWTRRTGISTVVLRPILVLSDHDFGLVDREQAELGAFVHVDDVAKAVVKSLSATLVGHVRLTSVGQETLTLRLPRVPWAGVPAAAGREKPPSRSLPIGQHAQVVDQTRRRRQRQREPGPGRPSRRVRRRTGGCPCLL